jgi:glutamate formiminotransferase/glutamate formiminotransferase/formiminotetrahydrofolate cyclodeaminase
LPDFGPPDLHPSAGAVVIGARPPLIAYNVNLDSRDLSVAKDIAKTIRTSNGGLPHVKAIGVALASRGLVQVSMNLTDFETTSIYTAFHAVKREADRHGVKVCQSEIIGLVPQRALLRPVESAMKLEGLVPSQILEIRLEMIAEDLTKRQFVQQDDEMDVGHSDRDAWSSALSGFLDAVQAGTPTPGGGSVTALAAALAAALGLMACHIEAGREGIQNVSVTSGEGGDDHLCIEEIQARLRDLEQRLRLLIEADAEAYSGLLQAYGMPKDAPSRMESIATSLRRATAIPVEVASYAWDIAVLLNALRQQTNSPLSADLKVGILMAVAAMEGGLGNAVENLKVIKNPEDVSVFSTNIADLKQRLVLVKSL